MTNGNIKSIKKCEFNEGLACTNNERCTKEVNVQINTISTFIIFICFRSTL